MNRRVLMLVTVGVMALAALMLSQLKTGEAVDACASKLVTAALQRDEATLGELLDNHSVRQDLLHAGDVQHLFGRPRSSDWSQVGLAIRKTATSTSARLLVLLLENEGLPRCRFLQDLERGTFH